jgi:hypothetical protein
MGLAGWGVGRRVGGFMSNGEIREEAPWRSGVRSARANLVPGLMLQAAALALVLAYYRNDTTREVLGRVMAWREEVGVWLSMATTGFFGGLLPMLYLKLRRATRGRYSAAQVGVVTAFWTYKGFEVDLLYRLLARFVGEGNDFGTIAVKTVIDQFVYCPVVAVPLTVLVYEWVSVGFDARLVKADVQDGGWVGRRVMPVLISNVGVWLPAVCIIYTLPTALQLPLQNLVLCFFTLLVAHQTRRGAD